MIDDDLLSSLEHPEMIKHMVYGEGKQTKRTYESTINVVPFVDYYLKIEVLRNDLESDDERVSKITIDGVEVGDCNPDGGDYDCTFFNCQDSLQYQVVSSINGSISVAFTYEGHSWDCDCNKETWTCSKENTVKGLTPMTAVARITLTPYLQGMLDFYDFDVKTIELIHHFNVSFLYLS